MHVVVVPGRIRQAARDDNAAGGVPPAKSLGLPRVPLSRPVRTPSRLVGIYSELPGKGRDTPGSSESGSREPAPSCRGLLREPEQLRLQLGRRTAEDRVSRHNHVVVSDWHLCSDPAERLSHQPLGPVALNSVAELLCSGHAEPAWSRFRGGREEDAVPPNSFISRHIRVLERGAFPHPETGGVPFPLHGDQWCW